MKLKNASKRKRPAIGLMVAAATLSFVFMPHAVGKDIAELSNAVSTYLFEKTPANLTAIKKFLKQGVKPDWQLASQAVYYKAPELVDLLLAQEPKLINQANQSNGETLLLFALNNIKRETVSEDERRIIENLIKAGADLNVQAQGGTNTPLIAAVRGGSSSNPQPDLVQLLLKAGADPKRVTSAGFTALTGKGASNLALIKMLIAAGADPYVVTKPGSTPLHFVCGRAYSEENKPDPQAAERIALLLKPGTSVDALLPESKVGTPLYESLHSHNPDCVKALLKAGANPDAFAYQESYTKEDPSVKGKTVRQLGLENAAKYPDLYSPAIVGLLKKK